MSDPPFGGGRYLIDTSAATRAHHRSVQEEWRSALVADQLVVCPAFLLEALYSARDAGELEAIELELAQLPQARINAGTWRAAAGAVRELAAEGPGRDRVKVVDALVAATAQENALGVIHYDEHYDRLAGVLAFESRWLAPRGSL